MSTIGTDRLVEEYLERLTSALAALPTARRAEIVNEIAQHVTEGRSELGEETEAAVLNMLDRLGPPEEIASEALQAAQNKRPDKPGRSYPALATAAIALAAVGIAVGALVATAGPGTTRPHFTANTGMFKAPPATTALVTVERGQAYGHPWTYSAQVSGPARSPDFSTNLSFEHVLGAAGQGGGGPWQNEPKFQIDLFRGGAGLNARFFYGVTSLPAVKIEIEFVRSPSLVFDTMTNTAFPGLRFFSANLLDRGPITKIAALGTSGTPLVSCPHNDGSEADLCTFTR